MSEESKQIMSDSQDSFPRPDSGAGTLDKLIQPLGDQTLLVTLADEAAAVELASAIRLAAPPWLCDVVPAYARVGVYFEPERIRYQEVVQFLINWKRVQSHSQPPASQTHRIPVCYEQGPDLATVAALQHLTTDELIQQHLATEYTVYAIGFVPGFPYMGYLPESLTGVGRLASPRVRVEPGSVGITGRQTAIYPLPRPGGWHLIGRTPLTIVAVVDDFFPLRVGDRVQFERIDSAEFQHLQGERLQLNARQS